MLSRPGRFMVSCSYQTVQTRALQGRHISFRFGVHRRAGKSKRVIIVCVARIVARSAVNLQRAWKSTHRVEPFARCAIFGTCQQTGLPGWYPYPVCYYSLDMAIERPRLAHLYCAYDMALICCWMSECEIPALWCRMRWLLARFLACKL